MVDDMKEMIHILIRVKLQRHALLIMRALNKVLNFTGIARLTGYRCEIQPMKDAIPYWVVLLIKRTF